MTDPTQNESSNTPAEPDPIHALGGETPEGSGFEAEAPEDEHEQEFLDERQH